MTQKEKNQLENPQQKNRQLQGAPSCPSDLYLKLCVRGGEGDGLQSWREEHVPIQGHLLSLRWESHRNRSTVKKKFSYKI